MRYVRQLCAVVVLTVLFAVTAFSGDLPYPIAAPPPPPPSASAAGDLPYPGAITVNPVTEVALNLFQSVLALF